MRKKTKSTYDKFVDALLETSDEFILNPKNRLTLGEAIGAMYAFVRISEMYMTDVINKDEETHDE